MRICHVVESMDKGAVENWLIRTFVHSRSSFPDYDWTFYCALPDAGRHADLVRSFGGNVVASPVPFGRKREFLACLRAFLKTNRFDVLHCHHDFLCGFYLWAAAGLPIGKRLVHVHNTDEALPTPSRWKHRLLLEPLRQTCLRMADGIVGISNHVLDQFLRHRPRRPKRDVVCYYGVDVSDANSAEFNPAKFRLEMGVPADAKILLFVGRMVPLKNPTFVVDVLKATLSQEPNAYAVFAGEGNLMPDVLERADNLEVRDRIRLLGWRDDTAYLMKNSDVFVFPRLETPVEGLGLVVVESQACGLPMITTPGVCDDAIINPQMVTRIALTADLDRWASSVTDSLRMSHSYNADTVAQSRFGMDSTTAHLLSLYN